MSDVATARVALDLSGSLEPLGNTMTALAKALRERGTDLCTFATSSRDRDDVDVHVPLRWVASPLWERGRGPRVDRFLPPVDVIHCAGPAVPPTGPVPVLISVDDLRPLRDDDRSAKRALALRRAVRRGARLAATSHAARRELLAALDLDPAAVVIAHPAVPTPARYSSGNALVLSVTGTVDRFLAVVDDVRAEATRANASLEVLASPAAAQRLRDVPGLRVRPRRDGPDALAGARAVVHLSDGARFPSLAIAAMAAGVPTAATQTDANNELLGNASLLVDTFDTSALVDAVRTLLHDEAQRRILIAAGRDRATDFTPAVAAARYEALYRDLVAGGALS